MKKIKELPHDPAIPFPCIYPKDLNTGSQTKSCTWIFIAVLFIIVLPAIMSFILLLESFYPDG